MSTDNKAIVRSIFEDGFNKGNTSVWDKLIASNYVNHNMPVPAPGVEGFKMIVGMFTSAFPDMRVTLEDVVAEGERVATRGYFTGTHKGTFNGIPATGKSIKTSYIDVWRLENGKAVENWVVLDMVGLLQQLGVMPSSA